MNGLKLWEDGVVEEEAVTLSPIAVGCTVYSVQDDITMTGETCFVMVSRADDDPNEDESACQMQNFFIQHLPLQPRAGSASGACCAPKGYNIVAASLASRHTRGPGQYSTLPYKSVITSDTSERSVSMHAECLQILQLHPFMALSLMKSDC